MRTQEHNTRWEYGRRLIAGTADILAAALVVAVVAIPLHAQRAERPALAHHRLRHRRRARHHGPSSGGQGRGQLYRAAEPRSGQLWLSSRAQGHQDHRRERQTARRRADGRRGDPRDARLRPLFRARPCSWTFEYEGTITGSEDGPIEGLKLAAIQEPISYLLYPARWFPTTGYLTDRFTAEMHIRVPQGMRVFASGSEGASHPVTLSNGKPGDQFDFNWTKPGFPGTVIAGRYVGPVSVGAGNVKVYLTDQPPGVGQPAGADGDQGIRLLYRQLWRAGDEPFECDRSCRTTPCRPSGRRSWRRFRARGWATRAASACWPTPSRTSGGVPRSARER